MKFKYIYLKKKIFGRYTGITLFPFVFLWKYNPRLIKTLNHERIHEAQFRDEPLAFYPKYLWYWVSGLFKYGGDAYRNIPYEREAYDNDLDYGYLVKREKFAYKKYKDGYECPHTNKVFLYNDNRVEGQKWYNCQDCHSMVFTRDD